MSLNDLVSPPAYPPYIPEGRRPQKPPKSIVTDGKSIFGAFDGAFESVNIIDAKNPVSPLLPAFLKGLKIKEWEAYEVSFDEGFVCGAIYDMGPAVFNIMIFYDKAVKAVTARQVFGAPRKCVPNSLFNSKSHLKTGAFEATIENQFQDGNVTIDARYAPSSIKKTPMSASLRFTGCSAPTVTVMPLGKNRPLYTHKELFHASGTITIGDRTFTMNENSLGIIDDHKGYYPRKMHYDWITCMGFCGGQAIGLNLCKNQAENPELYSENVLWIGRELHLLPPVSFEHLPDGNWHIFDDHGIVELSFDIGDSFCLHKHVPPIRADYTAPYGQLRGYVTDNTCSKISLDGFCAMGEDINYIML